MVEPTDTKKTELQKATVVIGTRGSDLALAQAHEVRGRLLEAHGDLKQPLDIQIEVISTKNFIWQSVKNFTSTNPI